MIRTGRPRRLLKTNKEKLKEKLASSESTIRQPVKHRLAVLKSRCKRYGIPFSIREADFHPFPTHCPILGIELTYLSTSRGALESTASFDKIIPSLGYVKGNVAIISMRANRLKNDASLEELEALVVWLKKQVQQKPPLHPSPL